ncbi:unnamed protein product [Peronospora effusa]|nr:unnamed protein product [Peronospora effusa]
MFGRWRMVRPGMGKARTQYNHDFLLVYFKTAMVAVLTSGWDFVAEISHSSDFAKALGLILPQLALLAIIGIQYVSVVDRRICRRTHIMVVLVLLVLVILIAAVSSGFRMGISLCCCSRSFCPTTFSTKLEPDHTACGLVVINCYMAFIRKIAHFYGISSSVSILAAISFDILINTTRQMSARTSCLNFLAKTRLEKME